MSLMDSIKPTKHSRQPRIILHGPEKVGKSTFAAGAPNPIFLPTEEGLSGIDAMAFPKSETLGQFIKQCKELQEKDHDFRTVVVDSADWLERLIHDYICKKEKVSTIEKAAGGYGKGYLEALNTWRTVLRKMDVLNLEKNMIVILICHSRVVTINDPLHEPYDSYQMKLHSPKSGNGSNELLKEWCDVLLFADTEKEFWEAKDGAKTLGRAEGTGKRFLYAQPSPAYSAGSRYPLPKKIPLNWRAFDKALKGKKEEVKESENDE